MVGFQKRVNNSLQFRLSSWLSFVILTVAATAGIFSYASAFEEANELQDGMLLEVALLFDQHHLPIPTQSSLNRPHTGEAPPIF